MLDMVVTQNVDNLHQDAGSREVVEFHGNARRFRCLECQAGYAREQVDLDDLPPRCFLRGIYKTGRDFFWRGHSLGRQYESL